MEDQIPDLDSLQLDGTPLSAQKKARKSVEPYLRGPIPWAWLRGAIAAGSAAQAVGLAIWHYRALKKALDFPVSLRDITKMTDQSANTARRGLQALEEAGLITRTSTTGRKPRISILQAAKP